MKTVDDRGPVTAEGIAFMLRWMQEQPGGCPRSLVIVAEGPDQYFIGTGRPNADVNAAYNKWKIEAYNLGLNHCPICGQDRLWPIVKDAQVVGRSVCVDRECKLCHSVWSEFATTKDPYFLEE